MWSAHVAHFWLATWAISLTWLILGEQPEGLTHIAHQKRGNERFAHKKKKVYKAKFFWANRSIAHFLWATWANCSGLLICLEWSEQSAHSHLFPLIDLSDSLTVAHFLWAAWVIRSRLCISSEQPERFPHGRSLVLSDLSELLTVAHLILAKWANERITSPANWENFCLFKFYYNFDLFPNKLFSCYSRLIIEKETKHLLS